MLYPRFKQTHLHTELISTAFSVVEAWQEKYPVSISTVQSLANKWTNAIKTERRIYRPTCTDKQVDRQTDRQAGRQTDRGYIVIT